MNAQSRTTGRTPRLSRRRIVALAHEIIAAEGVEALSMRRLAREVGTTPMALYHHVRDKDELLSLVMEAVAESLPRPPLPEDPRERLIAVCVLMRNAFLEHTWVVPILARGHLVGPSAVWMTEEILSCLVATGLTVEEAFGAHQTIWNFTAGEVLVTARARVEPETASTAHFVETQVARQGAGTLPVLGALAGRSRELEARYSYRVGLEQILDGVLPRP
ncbi:TetR/AcrR family transcriptional regulator [Streptoalloteichus hindustanus]|uniref:Transcriptional regulator, TetR family n=1 Tax=Streptoalloteichus hindustanus TaxID=2017 RepID=A0A1M5ABJ4_STRHI|nr:TetR/AcrR family transcriptional regulator [Streptoalloteichus hindustanus]SHF27416.1 transcriptional regulator, TetR family [Streptoalloteichus hindustanus]